MVPAPFQNSLILTGPTGSGKTQLGLQLAERLGAEIISMDSMALYRGMDVGTAKPGPEDRSRVRHHLLDVLDPWQSASVAWWLEQAAACCHEIERRGKRTLFVGGTALYHKALLHGLFQGPPADPGRRARLEREANASGGLALHERLAHVDPITAARIHPHDVRRIIRALEVWELTGRPISAWQTQWEVNSADGQTREPDPAQLQDQSLPQDVSSALPTIPGPSPTVLWLNLPRVELYARINRRVREMIDSGLIEEARALRDLPYPISREAAQALGYKEMFEHLDGRATLDEAIARIQVRSRRFAKRQVTWFRHIPECHPATMELTFPLWGLTMN